MKNNKAMETTTPDELSCEEEVFDNSKRFIPKVSDRYIPSHLQVEVVSGFCNARCIMCSIDDWTRPPKIMDQDTFVKILEKFLPIRDRLHYLTLHCWGESLLDKKFPAKVKIASDMGFRGIGFATNCELLVDGTARALLNSGLNTVICSIDGITKETHETIRLRTNYDKILANVLNFIKVRNELKINTKVLIRFIRQQANAHEWDEYREYWESQINPEYGDNVAKFDVHNIGGNRDEETYGSLDVNKDIMFADLVCSDIFEKFLVFADGSVAFCDADYDGFFETGNVLDTDPIEIYNSDAFNNYRKKMMEGKILELEHCKTCTIPRSRLLKTPTV